MHVLLDAHVFSPRGRGMSHFAEKLIHGLEASDCGLRFTVLTRYPEHFAGSASVRYVRIPNLPAPVWEQVLLPWHLWRIRPEVLHSLANTVPAVRPAGTSTVVTLHDVMFWHPSQEISAGETFVQRIGRLYRSWNCGRAVPSCQKVLTVSDYSRNQIEERFPAHRGRVGVLYQGPSLVPPPPGLARAVPGPYLLLPGGTHSRKNVPRAIEAFLRFKRSTGAPSTLCVFGVGPEQLDLAALGRRWGETGLEASVRLLGYVPEAELWRLFADAELLFFPSLCEGFGIPILDAITLGKPVVTSSTCSMPEIGGRAALYVDPWSVEDMARALCRLYLDPELKRLLASEAAAQARKFQWSEVTSRTIAVYRSLARP